MAKLGDFGLAELLSGEDEDDQELESEDNGKGTAIYMPPEQLWWMFYNRFELMSNA